MPKKILALFLWLLLASGPAAAADAIYLGVATCGNSTCHGSPTPLPGSVVVQNEFLIWSQHDKHSRSFGALRSDAGAKIAANLGLGAADKAPECLACHASSAAPGQRGKAFRMEDGVGCETCHGASSNWLGLHASGTSSREQNVAAGMYPTHDPSARAQLCLGCHQFRGNESQHRLYSAGHPRLKFELDTYTESRSAHHRVDSDYKRRKPGSYGARAWLLGQMAASRKLVDRLLKMGGGLWPDYDVYACFGCHRRFQGGQAGATGFPPLQDASVQMSLTAMRALGLSGIGEIEDALRQLNQALSSPGGKGWKAPAERLSVRLMQAEKAVRARSTESVDARKIYMALLQRAGKGDFSRHHLAEQSTYALASLRLADPALALLPAQRIDPAFDELFAAAGMAADFDAQRWQRGAQMLADVLPAP